MIIFISLLVALAGILIYFIATSPKLVEIGRIMFACGVLAFLLNPGPVVSLLTGAR